MDEGDILRHLLGGLLRQTAREMQPEPPSQSSNASPNKYKEKPKEQEKEKEYTLRELVERKDCAGVRKHLNEKPYMVRIKLGVINFE